MNTTKEQIDNYLEFGYVIVKDFFNQQELDELLLKAKRIFTTQIYRIYGNHINEKDEQTLNAALFDLFSNHLQVFLNCGKQVQHLMHLHRLSLKDEISSTLNSLGLTTPAICTRPALQFNHRKLASNEANWKLPPHQDWRQMQGSLDAAVLWFPLVNVDVSLGALQIIPGTHTEGLYPTTTSDYYVNIVEPSSYNSNEFIDVELETGDALFFSSFLLHRSGENITDRIRWSCQFRYNNMDNPAFIEKGYPHGAIYHPIPEIITKNYPEPGALKTLYKKNAK